MTKGRTRTMSVDLHIHTTASDGRWTPAAIGREAAKRGLAAIAVTDHDTVGGLRTALAHMPDSVTMIPGIELSSDYRGSEVHILGYWIDYEHRPLLELLARLRAERAVRTAAMVERLIALGFPITVAAVEAEAGDAACGRVHIAAALQKAGYCQTKKEAFARWLGLGRPAYVPRAKIEPAEAVQALSEAGGLACLAHPALMNNDSLIPYLVDAGLTGIEVIHSAHSAEDQRRYWQLAQEYQLAPVGGSDCHGPGGKDQIFLGQVFIPDTWLARLESARTKAPVNLG